MMRPEHVDPQLWMEWMSFWWFMFYIGIAGFVIYYIIPPLITTIQNARHSWREIKDEDTTK